MAKLLKGGLIGAAAGLIGLIAPAAQAQTAPTEYLVQQVCSTNRGIAVLGDPVACPTGTYPRKLLIGEALPYHKIDFLGYQISDSIPIDAGSISLQTYYFTDPVTLAKTPGTTIPVDRQYAGDAFFGGLFPDTRFPNQVHFEPQHQGYNILGADTTSTYFRGTYDPKGGWQPWWTASCQAKGWLLMANVATVPNTAAAYGNAASPTDHFASCPGNITPQPATVEWNHATLSYATGKTLDTYYAYHYAPNYGALEASYFTREYGVTRFEAWNRTPDPAATAIAVQQCPDRANATTVNLHTFDFYLTDCRDWSKVVYEGTASAPRRWAPAGTAINNPNLPLWPVDPLYTWGNFLKDGYLGGPYVSGGSFGKDNCAVGAWQRSAVTGAWLNWAWGTANTSTRPMTTDSNCTLIFSTPDAPGANPSQSVFQIQNITQNAYTSASYGATLWAPDWTSGTQPQVRISLIQRNFLGLIVDTKSITVSLSNTPAVFRSTAALLSSTRSIEFKLQPLNAMTNYQFTGAWAAPRSTSTTGCAYC